MDERPLVLDMDGTFLRTDMLLESFWAGLGQNPLATLRASFRHFMRPAVLKAELARIANLRTDLMPVNEAMADVAAKARAEGREVVLASASHETLVARVAADHGLSARVFSSDGETNLKGARKAQALVAAFGEGGFDYAGNAPVDRAIWHHAAKAIVVGDSGSLRFLGKTGKPVESIPGGWAWRDLFRALRPHQWVKNILLLVPLIAAHQFGLGQIVLVLLGMASFSAAASSIYVVNDLLDLEADRLHVRKKNRPFASGAVPIGAGMVASVVMGFAALSLAGWLGLWFFLLIALYMSLSLSYSLVLKRKRWIDVGVLAGLYTLRVVAGAVAAQVAVSGFLLGFIFPVFLALGCVKRLTEVTLATSDERLPGRGYGKGDRGDLLNVAILGSVVGVFVFFLYSFSEQATRLYPDRWLLWVAALPIALWLYRMVRLGYLGLQDHDPIVFAMRDKRGIGIMLIAIALMFWAAGLWQAWFGF